MAAPFGMDMLSTVFMAVVILGAAFIRGYSGFGFSALVVSAAALVTEPLNFVPVVMFCEFAMTAQQWRSLGPHVDWRRVRAISAGALIGVPVGLAVITRIGADPARVVIALYVLAMCAVLARGWRLRGEAGTGAHVGAGVVSGLANAPGMGGLPLATFFAAQGLRAATFRATLVVYFALLDAYSAPLMWWHGMIGAETFRALAFAAPFLLAGVWAGGRHFLRADPQDFRRMAVGLLSVLAALVLVKVAFA